ncbi:MAG: polyprenyl synthetase family protein [Candidatus Diapherotrites archaeon]
MSEQPIDIKKFLSEGSEEINTAIEKLVPHTIDVEWLEKTFGKPSYGYDVESIQKGIIEPMWDLLDRGGKRWRPALFLLSLEAVGGNKEKYFHYTALPEIIHNGTLIADDVEDSSELRRGKPCIHKIYGVDVAVNLYPAMFFFPFALVWRDPTLDDKTKIKLAELITFELLRCHAGQGLDIWWHRGNKYNVSENEYLQMCAYKTGTLARLSAKMGAVLGKGSEEQIEALGKFAETIGVAFQIQDDILNLVGEEFGKGKGAGEDIHEGKRTIMVLHTLEKATPEDKRRLLGILNAHPEDEKTIQEAIEIIKKYGGIEYGAGRAKELVEKSWKMVEKVLPSSHAKNVLQAFAHYLINRKI